MQQFIHNTTEINHFTIIKSLIEQADEIKIAVAFYRNSGWNLLKSKLKEVAKNGCQIEITCGLDFGFSEPQALTDTLQLFSKYSNTNLYFSNDTTTFHPKVYYFKIGQTIHIVSGSTNFTHGGLVSNQEASLYVIANETDDINAQTISFFNGLKREAASHLKISQYKPYFQIQEEIKGGNVGRITEVKDRMTVNYKGLDKYYDLYKQSNDLEEIAIYKTENYKKAKAVLLGMVTKKISEKDFKIGYEKLVGAKGTTHNRYWSSNNLFRGKTTVIDQYKQFINLLNYINDNQRKAPSIIFDGAKRHTDKINRVGINVLTEVLLTFDTKRFPALNQNSIDALDFVGCRLPNKNSLKGIDYEEYANLMKEIRDRFEMTTFAEVDYFLNKIYQEVQRQALTNP
jgi:HKD family nuclease